MSSHLLVTPLPVAISHAQTGLGIATTSNQPAKPVVAPVTRNPQNAGTGAGTGR